MTQNRAWGRGPVRERSESGPNRWSYSQAKRLVHPPLRSSATTRPPGTVPARRPARPRPPRRHDRRSSRPRARADVEQVLHMVLAHRVHRHQGRQLKVRSVVIDHRAEIGPESFHAAGDAVKVPLDLEQGDIIELHGGWPHDRA